MEAAGRIASGDEFEEKEPSPLDGITIHYFHDANSGHIIVTRYDARKQGSGPEAEVHNARLKFGTIMYDFCRRSPTALVHIFVYDAVSQKVLEDYISQHDASANGQRLDKTVVGHQMCRPVNDKPVRIGEKAI